jgi:hypothetical protein
MAGVFLSFDEITPYAPVNGMGIIDCTGLSTLKVRVVGW